jgi:hypothetical protein
MVLGQSRNFGALELRIERSRNEVDVNSGALINLDEYKTTLQEFQIHAGL